MTTFSVKMADDPDIPPLEDMTDILQKAELIREQRHRSSGETQKTSQKEEAKKRAKVTKTPKKNVENNGKTVPNEKSDNEKDKREGTANVKPVAPSSQGMFGGMKKGFLFGAPSKQPTKASSSTSGKPVQDQKANKEKSSTPKPTPKEEMPFIKPAGKKESDFTFNEVQQAMSEAKGLLDNQEWITDDFLTKVEKNDTLLKRFSDPQFMSALQEFQTNPQAAMEKYKGNQEVEKFLMEFCGLLGDHFTKLGSSNENPQTNQNQGSKPQPVVKPNTPISKQPAAPKIVEIGNGDADDKSTKSSNSKSSNLSSNLNTVSEIGSQSESHILIRDSQNGADIREIDPIQETQHKDDDAVREVLNDPKVMETLMDPKVMGLIKTLREDPEKGQRIIDKADKDLKEKVRFLVARGLLQFQMS